MCESCPTKFIFSSSTTAKPYEIEYFENIFEKQSSFTHYDAVKKFFNDIQALKN